MCMILVAEGSIMACATRCDLLWERFTVEILAWCRTSAAGTCLRYAMPADMLLSVEGVSDCVLFAAQGPF
jgi:hypothetical protein